MSKTKQLKCSEKVHTKLSIYCAKNKRIIREVTDEAIINYISQSQNGNKKSNKKEAN